VELDLTKFLGTSESISEFPTAFNAFEDSNEETKVNEIIDQDPFIEPYEPIFENMNATPISVEKITENIGVETSFHK
jgi:hypothetical protein